MNVNCTSRKIPPIWHNVERRLKQLSRQYFSGETLESYCSQHSHKILHSLLTLLPPLPISLLVLSSLLLPPYALSPCFQCKIIIYYHTYDTNISPCSPAFVWFYFLSFPYLFAQSGCYHHKYDSKRSSFCCLFLH